MVDVVDVVDTRVAIKTDLFERPLLTVDPRRAHRRESGLEARQRLG